LNFNEVMDDSKVKESENASDEQTLKKGRHRKKQLYNSILQQMEFYFSDSNLSKDRFLAQSVKKNPCKYINIIDLPQQKINVTTFLQL
jgi:hypothetical protein